MKPYPSTQLTATSVKNTPNNPLNSDLPTGWIDPRKTTWSQVSKLGPPLLLCCLMQACAGNELDSTALGAKEGQGSPPSAAYVQEMRYDPQHDDPSHDSFLRLRGGMLGSEETQARTNPPPDTPLGAPAPSITPPAETKATFTLSPTQAYWQKLPEPQRAKLRTTTGLVEAFNQAQAPEARTALREWLHAYVTWYDNQPLGIQKERVEEYMTLVKLVPNKDDKKDQELLQRYLASFINKLSMQELHASEENAIEALATSLPLLSPHTFQGSKTLVELSQMLTQKLVRLERNHLTAGNFPAYRHTLEALHQTFFMLKLVSDEKWAGQGGLYESFSKTLGKLKRDAGAAPYYPYTYQISLLEQSLERLKAQPKLKEKTVDVLQRIGQGVQGTLKLAKGLRGLLSLDIDLDAFEGSFDAWTKALKSKGIQLKAWYVKLVRLSRAANQVLQDPNELAAFTNTYTELSGAGTIQDEKGFKQAFGEKREDRLACCYGVVQQLVMLGSHTQAPNVRQACQGHLQNLRDTFCGKVLPTARKKRLGSNKKKEADYALLKDALEQGLTQLKATSKQPHSQEAVPQGGAVYSAVSKELALSQPAEFQKLVGSITREVHELEEKRVKEAEEQQKQTQDQLSEELKGVEESLKSHTDAQTQQLMSEFSKLYRKLDPITSALSRIERHQGRILEQEEKGLTKSNEILTKLEEAFKKPERPAEMKGIQTTAKLVTALNKQDQKHRATLQHYAEAYNTFFAREEVTALRLRHMLEYGELAAIQPRGQATKDFLQTYVGAWIAKIKHCQNPRKHIDLMQGVERMMDSLDLAAFAGDPTLLTRLAETLIAQLPNSKDQYTQYTHPSHAHTLKALNKVMAGIGAVAPDKWTFDEKHGLYKQFEEKIKVIKASQYGPFIYESVLLQQHLKELKKPLTMYQQGKYTFKGLLGLGQICLGLSNVFDWKVDGSQVAEGGKNVWQALQAWEFPDYLGKNIGQWIKRLRRAKDLSYEDLAQFSYAALGALKDPKTYADTFQESLRLLKSQAGKLKDEAQQYALHQAMVTQLTLLASAGVPLEGPQAELKQLERVRSNAKQELQTLLEEAVKKGDEVLVKRVLAGLAQAARNTAGEAKERIKAVLDIAWEKAKNKFKDTALGASVCSWMEAFQDEYNALKESGLSIWRALSGERDEQLARGVSLFELVEADMLAQQQHRRGIACRVVIQKSQAKEPIALSMLREIVHATAQQAPQGFASAAALRMAAYQATPSQPAQQQLETILKQQRAAWEAQEKAAQQEHQKQQQALADQQKILATLTTRVDKASGIGQAQRSKMLSFLRSLSEAHQRASEQLQGVEERLGHQIQDMRQEVKKGVASVHAHLRAQDAARQADSEKLDFLYRFAKNLEKLQARRSRKSPDKNSAAKYQARALREVKQAREESDQAYERAKAKAQQGSNYQQAGDYANAARAYADAVHECEKAKSVLKNALAELEVVYELEEITQAQHTALTAELKADLNELPTEENLAQVRAHIKALRSEVTRYITASMSRPLLEDKS